MKCPYKDNRFENTTSKYIYDEDGSLIENKITTCTASTFGKCDGEECAAYKDGVCQYVLVEKGGWELMAREPTGNKFNNDWAA